MCSILEYKIISRNLEYTGIIWHGVRLANVTQRITPVPFQNKELTVELSEQNITLMPSIVRTKDEPLHSQGHKLHLALPPATINILLDYNNDFLILLGEMKVRGTQM